jgi:Family of unknown function (DUF5343)
LNSPPPEEFKVPIQPDGEAPYNSAPATIAIIERFRAGTLQTPVTIDVLRRAGTHESLVRRTIKALRLLELIDEDGHPTEQFKVLARIRPDEYKDAFAGYLRSVYKDVFTYADPADGNLDAITNAFWGYKPPGQRETMVRLFLGLCEYAEVIPEQKPKRERPAPSPRKSKAAAAPIRSTPAAAAKTPSDNGSQAAAVADVPQQPPSAVGGDSRTLKLKSGDTLTITLSGPVLLLPKEDRAFVLQIIEKMEDYEIEASAGVHT